MKSTTKEMSARIQELSVKADWLELRENMNEHLEVDVKNPLQVAEKLSNTPRMRNLVGQTRIELENMLSKKEEEYSDWYAEKSDELFDGKDKGTQKERERKIHLTFRDEYEEKFGIMSELKFHIKKLGLAEENLRYLERALGSIAYMMRASLNAFGVSEEEAEELENIAKEVGEKTETTFDEENEPDL